MPASPSPIPGALAKTLAALGASQQAVKDAAAGTYKTPPGVIDTPAPAGAPGSVKAQP